MKLTEAEWSVLEILWSGERFSLKEIAEPLQERNGWSKNTVHTYLTRMEQKGLVDIDKTNRKPYAASVSREQCARRERDELLTKVYGGRTGDLVAAFLKETKISQSEVDRLRKLLDDMEV
ncbi:MAG: BlaI/MecI/CopY family transcriptional regulator [Oscillospiraceae bacterium]|nr:BlaI/MecI/CopY family transcriptional regulator [Oscillospiraceae bacterium]